MSQAEIPTTIPPEVLRELEEAIDRALRGVRDPEAMRRAAERMDRMRETMPETNIAVDLIREVRDEE